MKYSNRSAYEMRRARCCGVPAEPLVRLRLAPVHGVAKPTARSVRVAHLAHVSHAERGLLGLARTLQRLDQLARPGIRHVLIERHAGPLD